MRRWAFWTAIGWLIVVSVASVQYRGGNGNFVLLLGHGEVQALTFDRGLVSVTFSNVSLGPSRRWSALRTEEFYVAPNATVWQNYSWLIDKDDDLGPPFYEVFDERNNPRLIGRLLVIGSDSQPNGDAHWRLTAPAWIALAPAGGVVLLALERRRRRKRLAREGCCATCGYDLRASPDRCPECGTCHGALVKD